MSVTDFLFGANAPPNVNSSGTSSTTVPQFMSDYAQGVLAKANAVAGEGYQTYGGPRIAPLNQDQQAAYSSVRQNQGSYKPLTSAASNTLGGAAPTALRDASGYISAAQKTLPQGINDYLNPYIDNVTNKAQELATRSWNENIMPGINDIFVRNGTYGSSGQADKLIQGGRGVVEGLQSQAKADLAGAYTDAGNQFEQDQTRMGSLGQLVGQLSGQDTQNQVNIGSAQGSLASLIQSLGLKDSSALETAGNAEQGQVQKNLDLAYGDFAGQRDYDKDQVQFLANILNGLPSQGSTVNKTESAPLSNATYQPSTLNQVTSGVTGIAALLKALGMGN